MREAARAVSVHNVQPARWRFEPEGDLVLLRAVDRALPVADPTGHDVMLSLGAAFEGMAIALSRIGCTLGAPVPEVTTTAPGCEPVVRAPIVRTIGRDAEIDRRGTLLGRCRRRRAELQRRVALVAWVIEVEHDRVRARRQAPLRPLV